MGKVAYVYEGPVRKKAGMPFSNLLERDARFIFCGGKGGVGKTTVSAAIGSYMAKRGKKTLVFSTDPAHSLSDSFNLTIGNKLAQIDEEGNLWGLETNAKKVYEELKDRYKKATEKALLQFFRKGKMDMPFDREIISDMMELTPLGLDELTALSKLTDIIKGREYDLIVIDTAAGAHTLRLIELPDIFDEWIDAGLRIHNKYRKVMNLDESRLILLEQKLDIRRLRESILNSDQAIFVAVTIPEAMGISIAEKMIKGFKSSRVPCKDIVVNFVVPPDVECSYCMVRRKWQMKRIQEIREKFPNYKIIIVPLFPQQVVGIESLNDFAKVMFEGKYEWKLSSVAVEPPKRYLPRIEETPRLEFPGKYLVLFGGKGGCGKTTCSAATGIYMANHGKKTLVLSIDPQHSLSDSFDYEIVVSNSFHQETIEEATPIKGVSNLYAMEIDAERLLREWREENKETLIQIASDATVLDSEDVSSFLDLSLPGMDELMAQRKLQNLIKRSEFDLYILDTAPTGHTLRFLELPDMMSEWVKLLMKMRSKARYIMKAFFGQRAQRIKARADVFLVEEMDHVKRIKAAFGSPHTEFIPVTVLEEMAINESERLLEALKYN
ncbi:MAG: ArsA family ATPase, partial [Candidatus Bathyarchaeota archaeon]|nr:ArsA family ATPase [Candidatus Bathyarchaeota archaeon]